MQINIVSSGFNCSKFYMRILNICSDDWANFMHNNSKALKSVSVSVDEYKLNRHVFKYDSEAKTESISFINELILSNSYDIIQVFHSCLNWLNALKYTSSKVIVYHTGSVYRNNHEHFNNAFNSVVDKSVLALPEFWNLGAKNQVYCVGSVDIGRFKKNPDIIIGHYPSNELIKGTESIKPILNKLSNEFGILLSIKNNLSYNEIQNRLSDTVLYVELFKPELNGKKYGSFGITALEAASNGCIVITQSLSHKVYEKHYGESPMYLIKTLEELESNLKYLLRSNKEFILQKRKEHRDWIINNHSHEATGKYILNNVFNGL